MYKGVQRPFLLAKFVMSIQIYSKEWIQLV